MTRRDARHRLVAFGAWRAGASVFVGLACIVASTGTAAAAEPTPTTIACRDAAFREISPENRDDDNIAAIKKAIACVDSSLVNDFEKTGYRIFSLPPGGYESFLGFPALAKTFAQSQPDRKLIVLNEAVFVEPEQAVSVLAFQMQTVIFFAPVARAQEALEEARRSQSEGRVAAAERRLTEIRLETEVDGMHRARKVTHDLGVRCGADQYLRPRDVTDPVCETLSPDQIKAAIKKADKQDPTMEKDKSEIGEDDRSGGGLPPAVGIPVGVAAVVAMLAAIWRVKKGSGGRNNATGAETAPAADAARVLAVAAATGENVLGGGCASAAVCAPTGGDPLPERAPLFAAPVATPVIREDALPGQTRTNELVVPEPATLLLDNSGSPAQLPEVPVLPLVVLGGENVPTGEDRLANATQSDVVVDASRDSVLTAGHGPVIFRSNVEEPPPSATPSADEEDITITRESPALTAPLGNGVDWVEESAPELEQPVITWTEGAELVLVEGDRSEEAERGDESVHHEVAAEEEPWSAPVTQVTDTVYATTDDGNSETAERTGEVEETFDGGVDVVTAVVATDNPPEQAERSLADADRRDALGYTHADKYREDHPWEFEVKAGAPFRNAGAAGVKLAPVYPGGRLLDEGDANSDPEFLNGPGVLIALP